MYCYDGQQIDPSAMDVGCSIDYKNGDGKPTTSTTSTLTANATDITSTTIDTDTNNTIYCLHTDTWACKNCKMKADRWFMHIHDCSRKRLLKQLLK
ncbi:MAG: hypothetical protein WBZ20_09440 [Nitrososphaeraceae archaeon]